MSFCDLSVRVSSIQQVLEAIPVHFFGLNSAFAISYIGVVLNSKTNIQLASIIDTGI